MEYNTVIYKLNLELYIMKMTNAVSY